MLTIKRAYAPPAKEDGRRVLVDRLWPRGLSKEAARVDQWLRDLAPSDALRKWFAHDPAKWTEFQRRYERELATPEQQERLRVLAEQARKSKLTLVYSAADEEHNQAVVLRSMIQRLAKPASSPSRGPSAVRSHPQLAQRRR